jgi:hypothetical protein
MVKGVIAGLYCDMETLVFPPQGWALCKKVNRRPWYVYKKGSFVEQ